MFRRHHILGASLAAVSEARKTEIHELLIRSLEPKEERS
jgi:hypothetical protein